MQILFIVRQQLRLAQIKEDEEKKMYAKQHPSKAKRLQNRKQTDSAAATTAVEPSRVRRTCTNQPYDKFESM